MVRRLALIYDDRPRPETTGVYCLRALQDLVDTVDHFRRDDLGRVPRSGYDLYLNIDDGHEYRLPSDLRPCAWWVIDTHMNLAWDLQKAPDFDLVFAAQRPGAEALRSAGIASAEWLPLACDPEVHARHDLPKERDLCFVGHVIPGPRAELVALLHRHFPGMLVAQLYFEEMARAYSGSRLVFNRSVRDDVNMRVFEAAACGSLLLTNDLSASGQAELLRDGAHLATYRSAEELLDKARFYLSRADARERVAAAGRAEVTAKHTYRHRMERILAAAEHLAARTSASVPSASPAAEATPTPSAAAGPVDARDPTYFDFARPELLALIPATARDVLDVGCGAGRLGVTLKARQQARVTGIEFDADAARVARTRLDRVVQGDAETIEPGWGPGSFDAAVCGDVLEHLREPLPFLRRLRTWLRPGGRLVVSVPNVRHHSVVRGLLGGHWTYQAAGLLDRTHLRFFTRRELEKLLFRAGFRLLDLSMVPGAEHADWVAAGRPGEVRIGHLHVAGLGPSEAEEFHAYQYLAVAEPEAPPDFGLTSVVLVTRDACAYARRCVEGLRLATDEPHELIVVDDGSADDTPAYLAALGGARVIRNAVGRGYPAAADQGVRAAGGRQVLLLGDGTVLTTGCLRRLLDALHSDPSAGLVGPCSDAADGPQRVGEPYEVEEVDGFAWDWGRRHDGLRQEVSTLGAFCLLVRREVFDKVGPLAGAPAAGPWEGDLCRHARRAGYKALIARDAFVHHSGRRPLAATGPDRGAADGRGQPRPPAESGGYGRSPGGTLDVGLTSIVILAHNELAYTRLCIDSVRRNTAEPYELVLVDNGSTDGTADYFRTVPDATVIANADNRGFPAGANQGIGAAKGRQVLLLNNDTVVPPGWLGRLLRTLHRGPQVGLVGPCSNWVSGEQQVAVSYGEDLAGLDAFAAGWALSHAGQDQDTDRLVGFCLLVRREVFDKVGLLDERFGVGCFEDDDLCRRALRAGYRAAIARDAFVHHFGHRTFQGCGADFAAVMRENAELFRAKWAGASPGREAPAAVGPDVAAPAGPGGFTLRAAEGGGLLLGPARPLLSACLIVRDNARTIGACLTSIRPWVDELVVVDTGSTDETPAIAQRLGARVSHFAWCDDFSAARNESLRHARGRWLFWMDSDDTIDAKNGRALRELALRDPDPAVFGYVVRVHCPGPDGAELTAVDHVKLFRNRPDVRFDGRIHEQLLPAIRHAGGEVAWTDLFITHSGYDHSPEGQKRKLARDFRLLRLELAERPEHPFTLFNLGMTHNDIGEYEEASGWLRRSIAASGTGETHVRKAYALLAHALAGAGRTGEAQAACAEGLRQFPLDDELRFRSGVLLLEAGRAAESAAAFEDVLARTEDRHFTSVVDGLRGYRARQNLALAYAALGELGKAVAQWRAVTQEAPSYRHGWRGLGEALLAAGQAGEAQDLAGRLRRDPALAPEGHILAARAAEAAGDWPAARSALAGAVRDWPEDREVLREWCRHHFERGTPAEAEPVLERLVALGPDEPAAWHNLGAARLGRGDDAGAAEALRKSLQLRPRSVPTLVQLGHALRGAGRPLEAEQAWGEALRLSPNDREAASALERSRAERRGGGGRGRGR